MHDDARRHPLRGRLEGRRASTARASLVQANGDRYEGAFVAGRREGLGRAVSADGAVYEGGFSADKRSGAAVLTTAEGPRYTGTWAEGSLEGDGQGRLRRRLELRGRLRRRPAARARA